MTTDDDDLVQKLTFLDCMKNQKRLRKKLMELAQEDRCLRIDEQEEYFDLLGRSTFGLGTYKMFDVFVPQHGFIELGDTEAVARWLARQTKSPVMMHHEGSSETHPIAIGVLWERLLDLFDGIFARSLNLALIMSKEREVSQGGDAYRFDPRAG